jgi:hypothetical protein
MKMILASLLLISTSVCAEENQDKVILITPNTSIICTGTTFVSVFDSSINKPGVVGLNPKGVSCIEENQDFHKEFVELHKEYRFNPVTYELTKGIKSQNRDCTFATSHGSLFGTNITELACD